ncbi:MAG: hypothetical protein WDZ80_05580 [Candidatus Paceibacterota bacterium]
MRITNNEYKTLKKLEIDSSTTLRELVKDLNLGGIASAAYLINSLNKKELLEKVGSRTRKKYILTEKAKEYLSESKVDSNELINENEIIENLNKSYIKVEYVGSSGNFSTNYWNRNFPDGTDNIKNQ